MPKKASINVRLESALKKRAEQIFAAMGVSMSDAIALFLRQVIVREGMPFDLTTPNAETIAALEELERTGGEVFHGSTRELFDELA